MIDIQIDSFMKKYNGKTLTVTDYAVIPTERTPLGYSQYFNNPEFEAKTKEQWEMMWLQELTIDEVNYFITKKLKKITVPQ
jgi:hypothetical protein